MKQKAAEKNIPLSVPNFEGMEEKYVTQAVRERWVSTGGAFISQLEDGLAQYLKTKEVAACQSGTAAIHLAIKECGVLPGDYVIVPALTFIAAVNPVRYQFADPIFMDCDESLCIDPIKLRRFCEEECRRENGRLLYQKDDRWIKAIIVVHIFGNLADMEAIMKIASEYHLKVVEDATEALGSYFLTGMYKNKMAGTIGDYGAFSFNGNKIITTGGGGAITGKDSESVLHMKYLSTQAKKGGVQYIHEEIGFNYRMTNIQAALGAAQLENLERFIERKNQNYDLYKRLIQKSDDLQFLSLRKDIRSNCWFYALEIQRISGACTIDRIIEKLQGWGIQTRGLWALISEQKPYKECIAYEIEQAVYFQNHILNIPCSTNLKEDEIHYVAQKVIEVCGELK